MDSMTGEEAWKTAGAGATCSTTGLGAGAKYSITGVGDWIAGAGEMCSTTGAWRFP